MLERSKLAPRAGVEYQNARRRPYYLFSTGPKSIAEELKPASPEPSPAPSTPSWSGQFDQDRWVAEDVYSSMRDGYFVELGANNGLLYSNTVELERRYGWRGLCIEASWSKFAELQANRPLCTNLFAIVAADDTTVVKEVLVDDTEDPFATGQLTEYKRVADGAPVSEAEGEGRHSSSMRTLLRTAGAPRWIDFLSLDVEGFELDILRAWPWETYTIGALVVEHNFVDSYRDAIHALLRDQGYERVHSPPTDDLACPKELGDQDGGCTGTRCPCVDDWYLHANLMLRYRTRPH